jgi:hypothetical protein
MRSYAYANAEGHGHAEAAPDAEAALLCSLENVKAGARERLAGSRLGWLADSKGLVFRLSSVPALQHRADAGCLYSKPGPNTSSAFEASAAASEPFL